MAIQVLRDARGHYEHVRSGITVGVKFKETKLHYLLQIKSLCIIYNIYHKLMALHSNETDIEYGVVIWKLWSPWNEINIGRLIIQS